MYADECAQLKHETEREERQWPAGRYVRRTWQNKESNRDEIELQVPCNEAVIEKRESEELEKALNVAEEACVLEHKVEKHLRLLSPSTISPNSDEQSEDQEVLLTDSFGQRSDRIARQAWHKRMQEYVDKLTDDEEFGEVGRVLSSTRATMKNCLTRFRTQEIFRLYDGEKVQLLRQSIDYVAEENQRHEFTAAMSLDDAQQVEVVSSPRPFLAVEGNTDLQNILQGLETHGGIALQ
jgi:hypothetical protein